MNKSHPLTLHPKLQIMTSLPIVDVGQIGLKVEDHLIDEGDIRKTASRLMEALTTIGFVYITNHGIQESEVSTFVSFICNLSATGE